jgi:hypothetical protein
MDRELARAFRSLAPGWLSTIGFLGLPVLMGGLLPDGPMIATIIYIVKLYMIQDTSESKKADRDSARSHREGFGELYAFLLRSGLR